MTEGRRNKYIHTNFRSFLLIPLFILGDLPINFHLALLFSPIFKSDLRKNVPQVSFRGEIIQNLVLIYKSLVLILEPFWLIPQQLLQPCQTATGRTLLHCKSRQPEKEAVYQTRYLLRKKE